MSRVQTWQVEDADLAQMPDVFAVGVGGPLRPRSTVALEQGVLSSRLVEIEIARIAADSPVQTRGFDPGANAADLSLLESLRDTGQKTPIVVRELTPDGAGQRYELQGGHRRVAALKQLGRSRVTALVTREAGADADLRALIDNLGQPLTLLQLGRCLLLIQERHGLTVSRVAALSGVPRQRLSEVEAVMDLHHDLQALVENETVSVRAAAALRRLELAAQRELAARLPAGGLSYDRARDVAARIERGAPVAAALAAAGIEAGLNAGDAPARSASATETAAPWIKTWLDTHYPTLAPEIRAGLVAAAEREVQPGALKPRPLRLMALLADSGLHPPECVAAAVLLADTECGRTVVRLEEDLARLEALQAGGRFAQACAPLLPGFEARLERLRRARAEA